jgi:hypothetical protein
LNWRALAACASLAALLVVSLLIERPARPVAVALQPSEMAVLQTSGSGIQVTEGEQTMMLLNERAHGSGTKGDGKDVNYLATGSALRARYVDAETGYVTINNVYVQ